MTTDKFPEDDIYPPATPIEEHLGRDDSRRLRELLQQCRPLRTHDVKQLCDSAIRVWAYARSIAKEIGEPFTSNPPTPIVCRKAGGDCGCGGNCPPADLSHLQGDPRLDPSFKKAMMAVKGEAE